MTVTQDGPGQDCGPDQEYGPGIDPERLYAAFESFGLPGRLEE